eukprot:354469-Chlamydomonas_euryale.AAC.8
MEEYLFAPYSQFTCRVKMADDACLRVHTQSKRPVIRLVWGQGRPLSGLWPQLVEMCGVTGVWRN